MGVGTYGKVSLATCLIDKKQYALKIMDISKISTKEINGVFKEIEIHKKCKH